MKKVMIILFAVITVILSIPPFTAFAEDTSEPGAEIVDELDDILDQYDLGFTAGDLSGLSFGELLGALWDRVTVHIHAPMRILATVLLVTVFSSVIKSAGGTVAAKSSDIHGMVCVMAAAAVILPQFLAVFSDILAHIRTCGSFILVFVPMLTAVSAGCGKLGSAGVYHLMTLGASELIVKLSDSCLLPVLTSVTALGVTSSVFPGTSMESLVSLVKKCVTWAISVTMTLFAGFVTLKCTIAGKTDGAAAKTVKMMVSGLVPIVGGAVSDAYSTVKGSFEVIGGTVGAAGIAAVVMLMLPMIGELMIYRLVMWVGGAAAEIFSVEPLAKLLKSLDSCLAIAQSVLVCYMVMFVVCTAIVMQTMGG